MDRVRTIIRTHSEPNMVNEPWVKKPIKTPIKNYELINKKNITYTYSHRKNEPI